MKNLIWVASYPRSGNTWVRALLTSYLRQRPPQLEDLLAPLVSSRLFLDRLFPINFSELTRQQLLDYRLEAHRVYSGSCREIESTLLKIHDMLQSSSRGVPFVGPEVTKCVLYIVRNPLDVAVSLAHYTGVSLQEAVDSLNNPNGGQCLNPNKGSAQVPQLLSSWERHVLSWIDCEEIDVVLVKYEELMQAPFKVLQRILPRLGFEFDERRALLSIQYCSFEQLSAQEPVTLGDAGKVIRSGRTGSGLAMLDEKAAESIRDNNRKAGVRLGYF